MKDIFNKIRKLYILIKPYKFRVALLLLVILFASLSEVFSYSLLLPFLAILVKGESNPVLEKVLSYLSLLIPFVKNPVGRILLLMLVFQFLKSLFIIFQNIISSSFIFGLTRLWNKTIFSKYNTCTYRFYTSQKQGTMIHNTANEPSAAAICFFKIVQLCAVSVLSVTMISSLIIIDWKITVVFSVCGAAVLSLITIFTRIYIHKKGKEKISLIQKLQSVTAESILTFPIIKAFSLEKIRDALFKTVNDAVYRLRVKVRVLNAAYVPLIEVLVVLLFVSFIYFSTSFEVSKIGLVFAKMSTILIIAQRLLSKIGELSSLIGNIQFQLPSVALVYDLLHTDIEKEEIEPGDTFKVLRDDIRFDAVSFAYDENQVLHDLNVVIPRGKMTAFVGPSGAGKSTIINMLIGFYKPGEGKILINGKSLQEYSLKSWREKVGFVTQETLLFNMSIKENILLGKQAATEEEVFEAAKQAAIHDFILTLPDKYDTQVGDRGMKLSGGQKQRIAIARAILRDPEIYIFDEATSSLDNESEKLIQKSIETLGRKKTVIVIAHRLTTIENAHVVYDLGKIKAQNEKS